MTDTYRIRTPETWDAARDAYLSGETAEDVCARFDLGLRTFWARAAEQGWRRQDQPDPRPFHLLEDPSDEDLDAVGDDELRRLARRQMALAARRGRVGEALRWARLSDMVARQSQAEARQARDLAREEASADREQVRRTARLMNDVAASARSIEHQARAVMAAEQARTILRDLHDPHPVSDRPDPAPAEDPPMNRADRRRRLKKRR